VTMAAASAAVTPPARFHVAQVDVREVEGEALALEERVGHRHARAAQRDAPDHVTPAGARRAASPFFAGSAPERSR